jgi:hypothetical protein
VCAPGGGRGGSGGVSAALRLLLLQAWPVHQRALRGVLVVKRQSPVAKLHMASADEAVSGVVFPLDDGKRSTTALAKRVWAAAMMAASRCDTTAADALTAEKNWRYNYGTHLVREYDVSYSIQYRRVVFRECSACSHTSSKNLKGECLGLDTLE